MSLPELAAPSLRNAQSPIGERQRHCNRRKHSHMADGVLVLDRQDRIELANPAANRHMPQTVREVVQGQSGVQPAVLAWLPPCATESTDQCLQRVAEQASALYSQRLPPRELDSLDRGVARPHDLPAPFGECDNLGSLVLWIRPPDHVPAPLKVFHELRHRLLRELGAICHIGDPRTLGTDPLEYVRMRCADVRKACVSQTIVQLDNKRSEPQR